MGTTRKLPEKWSVLPLLSSKQIVPNTLCCLLEKKKSVVYSLCEAFEVYSVRLWQTPSNPGLHFPGSLQARTPASHNHTPWNVRPPSRNLAGGDHLSQTTSTAAVSGRRKRRERGKERRCNRRRGRGGREDKRRIEVWGGVGSRWEEEKKCGGGWGGIRKRKRLEEGKR